MQQYLSSDDIELIKNVDYLVGSTEDLNNMLNAYSKKPFADDIVDFLNAVSVELFASPAAKAYPDVLTFAFWIRKASVLKLKEQFAFNDNNVHLGRGIAFHIAPSNVPVNYAYSFAAGLMTGNMNVVRVPSKDFPQVSIINAAIIKALNSFSAFKPYIVLVKYEKNSEITSVFSKLCDTRIIWGGDNTVEEIRKSPIKPRTNEISFADRYSIAVIDSDSYLALDNKARFAESFYNDTYLTDQNACTSPRIVVWMGSHISEAKEQFWNELHDIVLNKYQLQGLQSVNKLTSSYLMAANDSSISIIPHKDNYLIRIKVNALSSNIMDYKDNSGYFFEYDANDILEIKTLCDDSKCQTIGYLGDNKQFRKLFDVGVKGVDRIVPIGKTMDFDLIWDGYNLVENLTRVVSFL